LARAAGYHPRSARYWEIKDSEVPTNVPNTLDNIEQALENAWRTGIFIAQARRSIAIIDPSNCRWGTSTTGLDFEMV
jgi:hypothetical protein